MPIHIHLIICFSLFFNACCFVVDDMLPQVSLAVQIDELNVKCNKETILLLKKFAVDNKVRIYSFSEGFWSLDTLYEYKVLSII